MSDRDIAFEPAHRLARLVADRKLSPVELVNVYLTRIEELNPKINAYLTVAADQALASAREAEKQVMSGEKLGPLHGVPVSIKDLESTTGIRTTYGSLVFKDYVPDNDTGVVERTRQSGAIILGKTNTPEFGCGGAATINRLGDPCGNPWNLTRTTGGSSGGAGAAVAAGLCPIAAGSDGGGSVRIPSSFCGVYGIKPTRGRVPRFGGVGRAGAVLLSQPGPLANSVRDAAMYLQVMAGPDERDPTALRQRPPDFVGGLDAGVRGLRIAYSPDLGYAVVDPEVVDVTSAAAGVFEEAGADVEEPDIEVDEPFAALGPIQNAGACAAYGHLLDEAPDKLTDYARDRLEEGRQVTGVEYARAMSHMNVIEYQMDTLMERFDLLLTPVMPMPAFPVGKPPKTVAGRPLTGGGYNAFNPYFNLTGQPAASVPCGFSSNGLPIGLHVVGRKGDEATVLRASALFEKMRPWADKHPPIS